MEQRILDRLHDTARLYRVVDDARPETTKEGVIAARISVLDPGAALKDAKTVVRLESDLAEQLRT